jgi:polysaccharide export outer membrane protein
MRFNIGSAYLIKSVALVLALAFSSAVSAGTPSPARTAADYDYILGPSDVVHVEVLNRSDFNVKAQVGTDGTITLPYIGSFHAADLTVSQLHDQILAELNRKGLFSKISLQVEIVGYASRSVTVLGSVATPGIIPVDRAYRLSEILARVGGVKEGGSDFVILRRKGGQEQRVSVDDLATGDTSVDPYVLPGDKIYIPTEVFYVKGQVRAPGAFPLMLNMTLAMALSRAGGVTDLGSEGNIEVIRDGKKIDPDDLNFRIEPNDVVSVGESWF